MEEDDPLILAPSIMRQGRMHALIVKGWAFSSSFAKRMERDEQGGGLVKY